MSGSYICGEEGRGGGGMKEERRGGGDEGGEERGRWGRGRERGGKLFYSLQDHPPGKDVTCYNGAFSVGII